MLERYLSRGNECIGDEYKGHALLTSPYFIFEQRCNHRWAVLLYQVQYGLHLLYSPEFIWYLLSYTMKGAGNEYAFTMSKLPCGARAVKVQLESIIPLCNATNMAQYRFKEKRQTKYILHFSHSVRNVADPIDNIPGSENTVHYKCKKYLSKLVVNYCFDKHINHFA